MRNTDGLHDGIAWGALENTGKHFDWSVYIPCTQVLRDTGRRDTSPLSGWRRGGCARSEHCRRWPGVPGMVAGVPSCGLPGFTWRCVLALPGSGSEGMPSGPGARGKRRAGYARVLVASLGRGRGCRGRRVVHSCPSKRGGVGANGNVHGVVICLSTLWPIFQIPLIFLRAFPFRIRRFCKIPDLDFPVFLGVHFLRFLGFLIFGFSLLCWAVSTGHNFASPASFNRPGPWQPLTAPRHVSGSRQSSLAKDRAPACEPDNLPLSACQSRACGEDLCACSFGRCRRPCPR